ncbi:M23 family metallopeptidase [Streptomyces sp. NA04227]|uniref:M23 family metallopeptidase n=1 Tax=Streptomyces sp. NA04227 TaxID=2742136 RepID=UPI0020CA4AFB|nr:M23 family metallopeptidase [Streptomyces sp. NA04227]
MAVVLCALTGLGTPAATATGVPQHPDTASAAPAAPADPAPGPESASAEVARLYAEAARTSAAYEQGRINAEGQRERAARAEELLRTERERARVLRRDLGQLAREQYRVGGGLRYAARMLLAADPSEMLRGSHTVAHANLAVDNAVARSLAAQRRLERTEREAAGVQRALDRQLAALGTMKQQLKDQLAQAKGTLQGEADDALDAGTCPDAARLDVPEKPAPGPWVAPVDEYRLSAGFDSAGARWSHRHTGQDFAVPIGTPVHAAGEGKVVRVACGGGFGIQVVIAHPNGYFTQYAHLAAPAVEEGERVRSGQWIGQSGTSGNSTGPHLHFEVRLTESMGSAVDPVPWMAEHGVQIVEFSGTPDDGPEL